MHSTLVLLKRCRLAWLATGVLWLASGFVATSTSMNGWVVSIYRACFQLTKLPPSAPQATGSDFFVQRPQFAFILPRVYTDSTGMFCLTIPLWVPFALVTLGIAGIVWHLKRSGRLVFAMGKPPAGLVVKTCSKCGYILKGNTSGVCSECGSRFGPAPQVPFHTPEKPQ